MSDTVSPEWITETLQIQPDKIWRRGDPRAGCLVQVENGWQIEGESEGASFDELTVELLSRAEIETGRFREVSSECTVELSCVAYCESPPELNFQKSTIQALSRIGASLDIDVYLTA